MTRWRLIKAVLAVSAVLFVGLGVAAGMAASRDSGSNDSPSVFLEGNEESTGVAWLGIAGEDSGDPEGVAVTRVVAESPAAKAGIETEDVITAFDGEPTPSFADLRDAVRSHEPGDEVTLTVAQGAVDAPSADETELTATLGEWPRLRDRFDSLADGLFDRLTEYFDRFVDA